MKHLTLTILATGLRFAPTALRAANPASDPTNTGGWVAVGPLTDEFTAAGLDSSKWYNYLPNSYLPAGGNADHINPDTERGQAYYRPENTVVSGGKLDLKFTSTLSVPPTPAGPSGQMFATAACTSKRYIRNGYFEAKLKSAKARVDSAFWLHKSNFVEDASTSPWTLHPFHNRTEIDIAELLGNSTVDPLYPRTHHTNLHIGGDFNNDYSISGGDEYVADYAPGFTAFFIHATPHWQAFHTYGFEWDDTKMTWYYDGAAIRTTTLADFQNSMKSMGGNWAGQSRFASHNMIFPMQVIMATDYLNGWHGDAVHTDLPAAMSVDYVRVWQKAGTGAECVADGTFPAGTVAWNFNPTTTDSTITYTGNEARIHFGNNPGNVREAVTLKQIPGPLNPNTRYRLNFQARASRPHYLRAVVGSGNGGTYSDKTQFVPFDPLVATTYTDRSTAFYSTEFTTPAILSGTPEIRFELGGADEPGDLMRDRLVILDNISLKSAGEAAPVVVESAFTGPNSLWKFALTGGGANMVLSNDGPAGLIAPPATAPSGGNLDWHVQLYRENLTFNAGTTYTVSFKAKTGAVPRTVALSLHADGGSNWFGQSEAFPLTSTYRTFSYSITPVTGSADSKIAFMSGGSAEPLYINDVVITATAPPSVNLVVNGDFSTPSIAPWLTANQAGGASPVSTVTAGILHTAIPAAGTDDWHIQVWQEQIPFVQGQSYTLNFKAKCATGTRPITVTLSGNYGAVYYGSWVCNLTTTQQSFPINFTAAAGAANGALAFMLGGNATAVDLDDISITH